MESPHDKIVEDSERLLEKYNIWRDQLIERAAPLAQAEMERQREPAREVVLQNGQKVSLYTSLRNCLVLRLNNAFAATFTPGDYRIFQEI